MEETLEELIGIKNKVSGLPQNPSFSDEPSSKPDAAGTRPLGQEWHDIMNDHGFTATGSGMYGTVWTHPNYNYVLKVFSSRDTAYTAWVNTCLQNEDNPHLPKFISPKIFNITDKVSAIRMEKLKHIGAGRVMKLMYDIDGIIKTAKLKNKSPSGLVRYYPTLDSYKQLFPTIMDAIDVLYNFLNSTQGVRLDIHNENVMGRGNYLVFTDPVATKVISFPRI